MSFLNLAAELQEIASFLKANAQNLDDKKFIKEVEKFDKSLKRLSSAIEALKEGLSPEANELKTLLGISLRQDDDGFARAAKLSLKITGKKTSKSKTDTLSSYISKVFKNIVAAGKVTQALKAMKKAPQCSVLDLSKNDELSLLEQIRKLGSLDEDQLDVEISRLKKHAKELRGLAAVAKIKVRETSKPDNIIKKLVQIGKRYHENTSA